MPRISPPDNESSEERFKRLAKRRAEEVIYRLHILRHCANTNVYSFTQTQVKRIFDAIHEELNQVEADFTGRKREINL